MHEHDYKGHDLEQELLHSSIVSRIYSLSLIKKVIGDSGEEERMKRQTSVLGIEPGPSDWKFSAPSTKPLPGTEVRLPILLINMLAVFIGYSVNIPLTDHLNLVPSEPL